MLVKSGQQQNKQTKKNNTSLNAHSVWSQNPIQEKHNIKMERETAREI